MGRGAKLPPQLGQAFLKWRSAQSAQNVHSKLHIIAWEDEGSKSRLQHSQFGFNNNIHQTPRLQPQIDYFLITAFKISCKAFVCAACTCCP